MKTYSGVGGIIVVLVLLLAASTVHAQRPAAAERHKAVSEIDSGIEKHARQAIENGRRIFRFDTFGSEAFGATPCSFTKPSPARRTGASAPE